MPIRQSPELPMREPMIPLPPFRQTPGPITVSQTYLRKLVLERWEAELKGCQEAKKAQILEIKQGPSTPGPHMDLQRLIAERWEAEIRRCEEARKAQLLEILLAAHGISGLV